MSTERQFVLPLKEWALLSSHYEHQVVSNRHDDAAAEPDAAKIKAARLERIARTTEAANAVLGILIRTGDINDLIRDLLVTSQRLEAEDVAVGNFAMCFFPVDKGSEFLPLFSDLREPIVHLTASEIINKCNINQIESIMLRCLDRVDFVSPQLIEKVKINVDEKLPRKFFHKIGLLFHELFMPESDLPPNPDNDLDNGEANNSAESSNENSNQKDDTENCQDEDEPGSEKGRLRRSISSSCKNSKIPHLSKVELSMQQKSIPVSICRLVSDLIEAGDEKNENTYESLQDVCSEVDQIMQEPDIFLKEEYSVPSELSFSQTRAFGRESELTQFAEVLSNVQIDSFTNTNNIILVGGEAGSGKSHLLSIVMNSLIAVRGGLCIHCKFDRLPCNQPLSTLSSAFDDYFRRLARTMDYLEDEGQAAGVARDSVQLLLDSIQRHLTTSGLVFLGGLIPSFHLLYPDVFGRVVIDEDDSISGNSASNSFNQSRNDDSSHNDNKDDGDDEQDLLGADNSRNRLHYLFRRLIMAMSNPTMPLSIFIDDLQWADVTSFSLLSSIMTDFDHLREMNDIESDNNTQGLMVVASYRTETLNEDFYDFTEYMETATTGVRFNRIILTGINVHSVNGMISDALKLPTRLTMRLAEEVYEKTVGSPLFVTTFLSALVEEGKLAYSLAERRWKWKIHEVQNASIGNDVAEVITQKLNKMSKSVRDAVIVASCFGKSIDKSIIHILDDSMEFGDILVNMENAVLAGVIQERGSAYSFPHDLVKQAAYDLLEFEEIEKLHFKIGLELVKGATSLDDPELNPTTFEAIQQLVATKLEVSDAAVQRGLAALFIKASTHAIDIADFFGGDIYVQRAKCILGRDCWHSNFDLSLQMHENEMYIAYLNKPQQVPSIFMEIVQNTTSIQQQIKSQVIWIRYLVSNGQLVEAVDAAFDTLEQLGEGFPREATPAIVKSTLIATKGLLESMSEDDVLNAPRMADSTKHWCMMVMSSITAPLFVTKPQYYPLLGCKMVQMSIQHGLCPESSIGMCAYSQSVTGLFCDIDEAKRIAKFAMNVVNRFNATKIKPRLAFIFNGFVNIWFQPLQISVNEVKACRHDSLLVGDQEYAMLAHLFSGSQNMMTGYSLHSLEKEIATACSEMIRLNQILPLPINTSNHQTVLSLTGSTKNPFDNIGSLPVKNEDELLHYMINFGFKSSAQQLYFNRMIVAFFFKKFDVAADFASKYRALDKGNARFQDIYHIFYQGLIAFRLARSRDDKSTWLLLGGNSIKKFQEWVNYSTWNFQNKLLLLEAEFDFCAGQREEAERKYKAAVESARRHKFVNEEGLALELSSLFYTSYGNSEQAKECLSDAIDCYKKWGADGILDLVGT